MLATLEANITFKAELTAALDSISPRYGQVEGGTEVTFSGTGFSETIEDYTILIDEVVCVVTAVTAESVTCTTGSRPGLHQATLSIYIAGWG